MGGYIYIIVWDGLRYDKGRSWAVFLNLVLCAHISP